MRHALLVLLAAAVVVAVPASAAAAPKTKYFRSPDGKTYCVITKLDSGRAACDVKQHTYPVPPKPSTCIDNSWGIGAVVDPAGADYHCTGQPLWLNPKPGPSLAVGKSLRLGELSCKSLKGKIRCESGGDEHGFAISRSALMLF